MFFYEARLMFSKQRGGGVMKSGLTLSTLTLFLWGALLASNPAEASCFGWRLVEQKKISLLETFCSYEKSGVRQNFIVEGFCPMSPPGC